MKNKVVGIIGGAGKMAQFFADIFTRHSCKVISSDLYTGLKKEELVKRSDILIISVPLSVTLEVIREIAPLLQEEQLLMDLTSLKAEPVKEMMRSKAFVIGLHPLFGPQLDVKNEKNVVSCPERPGEWQHWLYPILEKENMQIVEADPQEHDKKMALIQGLIHFLSLIFSDVLCKNNISVTELLVYSTSPFRMQLSILERMLNQDPALYGSIAILNPFFPKVIQEVIGSAKSLEDVIANGDHLGYQDLFGNILKFLASKKTIEEDEE